MEKFKAVQTDPSYSTLLSNSPSDKDSANLTHPLLLVLALTDHKIISVGGDTQDRVQP